MFWWCYEEKTPTGYCWSELVAVSYEEETPTGQFLLLAIVGYEGTAPTGQFLLYWCLSVMKREPLRGSFYYCWLSVMKRNPLRCSVLNGVWRLLWRGNPYGVVFIICGCRLLRVSFYGAALELVFIALRYNAELLAPVGAILSWNVLLFVVTVPRRGCLIMEHVAFCRYTAP